MLQPFVPLEPRLRAGHDAIKVGFRRRAQVNPRQVVPIAAFVEGLVATADTAIFVLRPQAMQRKARGVDARGRLAPAFRLAAGTLAEGRFPADGEDVLAARGGLARRGWPYRIGRRGG